MATKYRTWLYRYNKEEKKIEGKIFTATHKEIEALMKEGWVDSPARLKNYISPAFLDKKKQNVKKK